MTSLLLPNDVGPRNQEGLLLGNQEPRLRLVPDYKFSVGVEAIELARHAGLNLDPWQELAILDIMGEDDRGKYAAFEAALIVPRQNGKGSILEALELAWLFLCGDNLIIHTAHEFKTAAEGYLRVSTLIQNTPDLHKLVKPRGYHGSHGEEGITLRSGQRLRFLARSKGAGRGFTADKLVYDEAYELASSSVAASLPTLSARPNPQVIYTSSAPLETSAVLKRVRLRGMKGLDDEGNVVLDDKGLALPPSQWKSLCFLEWSAKPSGYDTDGKGLPVPTDLDDPRALADANPGMPYRITEEFSTKERGAMTDVEYARERLGIIEDIRIQSVIKPERWGALRDPDSVVNDPVAFAFDANPDRTWASIAVAGGRSDKRVHVELVDRKRGVNWLVDRIVALHQDWEPKFILVDAMSPAASLIPDLAERGIEVTVTSTKQYGMACGKFYDLYDEGILRHPGQPQLTSATEIATKRILAETGMWGWARRDAGDISPLVSATLAVHGYYMTKADPDEVVDNRVVVLRRR